VRGEVRAAFGNMLWKAVSLPLEKICRLLLVVVSAPLLGEAAFGRFQFAATVTTVLALGTDLGLGIWTTRALARSRAEAAVATIVRTGLRVKTLAALPYAAVTAVVAAAMGPGDERAALLLLGVSALVSSYVDHFGAVFRGFDRFRDETRLNAARSLLLAAAGLGALALQRSVVALTAGMAAGSLAGGLYGVWLIRPAAGPRAAWDPTLARVATREGLPIWLAGMFSLLYFKGDAVILRLWAGDAALGAYSAAYKIFEGAMLVPAIVLAAAFPPLARAHGDRPRQRFWERLVVAVLLALGLAVGGVCYLGRAAIIARIFRAGFADAVPSLRVLALGLPLLFLNYGLTHFLIARDLGRKNLVFSAGMLVLNVGLNLVLIPRAGGPGAAWATVLTELALTGCCLWTLRARPAARPASHSPREPAAARTDRMTG
jgi:O-antigen/teichoic acid export membrane protein